MSDPAPGLIETMRLDDGIPLLELHIQRLSRSAAFFGFTLTEDVVRARIADACRKADPRTPWRLRLVVDAAGTSTVSITPVSSTPPHLAVAVSATRVDPGDTYLYHKTTRRLVYDREWAAAKEQGLFEVVYLNRDNLVTEGSRTNIFVVRNGEWLTPPTRCGLLPGVYRSLVLDTFPHSREQVLERRDLERADALYICNAILGLKRVRLIDSFREFRISDH